MFEIFEKHLILLKTVWEFRELFEISKYTLQRHCGERTELLEESSGLSGPLDIQY